MSLLLLFAAPVVKRNKTELAAFIMATAPAKVRRDPSWWAAWLKKNG